MQKRGSIVFSLIFFLFLINFISAIPSNGLVAYYPFDGNSNDASGNGNNGIIYGNPQFVSGKIGSALNFDGVDDRINIANNPVKSNSNFSASFWFNGVSQNGKYFFISGNGILASIVNSKLRFYPGQGAWSAYTTSAVADNSWHHIAITHENQNTKIFFDGVQQVNSVTGNILVSSNLEIGARVNLSFLTGTLDDLAFYNRALTSSEIQQIYSEGSGNTCMPSCSGKQCGSDGCGGNCPPGCSSGYSCSNGQCIQQQTCIDNDGDGYGANCALGNDCNDNNANINPGKTEICGNGIDEDCSGSDLICNNQTTATGIIFEDNFDNYGDWSSSTIYGQDEQSSATRNLIFGGPGSTSKKGWLDYRTDKRNLIGNPYFQINSFQARGGVGKSLKYWEENNGFAAGGGIDTWFGEPAATMVEQEASGYKELYFRMYYKWQTPFNCQNPGGAVIKLFRINTGVAPDFDTEAPSGQYKNRKVIPNIYRSPVGIVRLACDTNVPSKVTINADWRIGQDTAYYLESPKTPNIRSLIDSGNWIPIQVHIKLNTVNQSDGIYEIWINNNDPNKPDVAWTGWTTDNSETDRLHIVAIDNFQNDWGNGTRLEQWWAYDDWVVSTSFIDNNYVIGNGTYLNQTIICIDNDHDGYNRSASGCGYRDCNDLDFSNFNVCNPGDTDSNGCVSQTELFAYMDRFYLSSKDVPLKKLGEAIELSYVC